MSIKRVCDCTCHSDGEGAVIWEGEECATFGDKDVCYWCLTTANGCRRWHPHVIPELTALQKQIATVYDDVIKRDLQQSVNFFNQIRSKR